MIEIINTLKIEIFLTITGGILIFVIQKLIIEVWINPNLEFWKCMVKIETLMIHALSLYKWEYKKNNLKSSKGMSVDEEIENFRKELNVATYELTESYCGLFLLEKFWLKLLGVNVRKARPALLALSVIICSKESWELKDGNFKIEKQMDKIYKLLKINSSKKWDPVLNM